MRERTLTLILVCPFAVWLLLWYIQDRGISGDVALAALPAFLLELTLYIAAGLLPVRQRLLRWPPVRTAVLMTVAAPASWVLLATAVHAFSPGHLLAIILLGALASFWYIALPHSRGTDLLFLAAMALPVVSGAFNMLYPDPAPRLPGQTLGVLMWYRTGLLAVLVLRRMEGINFGFVPHALDWKVGLRNYLLFLPPGFLLAFATGFVRLREVMWDGRTLLVAILTFAGVLWVLAVAEEFFFRGLLQQQLTALFHNDRLGLIAASVVFGSAHLAYRHFPNWHIALVATLVGFFCGRAYIQARSIRASMVTHALIVTTWRVFLA